MRTFTRSLSVLLAACFAVVVALANVSAPTGGWVGYDAVPDRTPVNLAATHAAATRALGCVPGTSDASLSDRAVIRESGEIVRMSFGQLARVSKSGARVWVIGGECR